MSNQSSPEVMAHLLSLSLDHAVQAYQNFAWQNAPSEAKEFAAFQSASKAALAHIEAILKLSRLTAAPHDSKTLLPDDELQDAQFELDDQNDDRP